VAKTSGLGVAVGSAELWQGKRRLARRRDALEQDVRIIELGDPVGPVSYRPETV